MRARPRTWLTPLFAGALCATLLAAGATTWSPSPPLPCAAPVRPEPPHSSPPSLVFDPPERSLGLLGAGEARCVDLAWRRTGGGPLEVLAVRAGCGCLVVGDLPHRLEAGGRGSLRATLRAPTRPGPFAAEVRVITDAARRRAPAQAALTRVRLTGWVDRPIGASPTAIDLGPRLAGTAGRAEVLLRTALGRAEDRPHVTLEGARGDVELTGPGGSAPGLWTARVKVEAPAHEGPFRASLAVALGDHRFSVPIRGRVVSDLAPMSPAGPAAAGSR